MKNNIISMPSPFPRNKRGNHPKRVILHAMGEYFSHKGRIMHAEEFLREIGLVAHFLVTPSGVGIRTLSDDICGSHAKGHNTDTLGIEFLVPGLQNLESFYEDIKLPYLTNAAYKTGQEIVKNWMQLYPIEVVTAHSVIDPDRKKDPGTGFPKQFYVDLYL